VFSAVSPLPEDFYANFGGDPFTDDAPHDGFMRSVFSRMKQPEPFFEQLQEETNGLSG